jgi:Na+-driven multidrug efflux pump
MMGLILGCICNIVLDYLFIMVFHWGVAGAAWATIIGRALNAVIYICYLFRMKTVKLNKKIFFKSFAYFFRVTKLGLSSFINQILVVIIIGVQNNLLKEYGALSDYGAEIPMTALGVTMKLFNIVMAVLIGLSGGSQPIWGYNYGSGRRDRVKKTFIYSSLVGTIIMVIIFAIFQIFPEPVISIFGHEDALYTAFSVKCLKIYLFALPLFAVRMMIASLFQAVGRPYLSAILSLSKQIIIQLPAMIIFSSIMGVEGVLWAGPVSDILSVLFAVITLLCVRKSIFTITEKEVGK